MQGYRGKGFVSSVKGKHGEGHELLQGWREREGPLGGQRPHPFPAGTLPQAPEMFAQEPEGWSGLGWFSPPVFRVLRTGLKTQGGWAKQICVQGRGLREPRRTQMTDDI